ncbi:MAG: chloride channel protein [Planctomycetes bacterium]|nr:chloride channel protein [Planctomycetota bacterium]MCB9905743.1 chloride channel protein [Planctomycetota bacterium]
MTDSPYDTRQPLSQNLKARLHVLGQPEERWSQLLLLALLAGLASGGAAVLLRHLVHLAFHALSEARHGVVAVLLPALGGVLGVAVVSKVFREPAGHGVPEVIRAVCRGGGLMRKRAMVSRWLGSLINVASGASAGLEGPTVYTGAAIGSAVGGLFHVDERRRSVLLACGLAGGISAIFNAPMTGMIFAMEVVLAEWSAFTIVPIVVASVGGTELSRLLLGDSASFLHGPFEMGPHDLALCVLLGLVAGLLSVLFVKGTRFFHHLSGRLSSNGLVPPAFFGLAVGTIGLLSPDAIGEGYDVAQSVIQDHLDLGTGLVVALLAAKLLASCLTLGSGSPGGIFAPSLVIGSLLGGAFARGLAALFPETGFAHPGSYALVGMAGLVAGVMQAPLTGIFLVLEVTRGYDVILPLMIVSVISLLVSRRFDRYSLYHWELAESGELLRPGTDQRVLAEIALRDVLDEDVTPVFSDMLLADFLVVLRSSKRNVFPVLESGTEEYVGMVNVAAAREILLDHELVRVTLVEEIMDTSLQPISADTSLTRAMRTFEEKGVWVLPVSDGERFLGIVSKSSLFDHYRRELNAQMPE